MLRKLFRNVVVWGAIAGSAQLMLPAQEADALIIAAVKHHRGERKAFLISGLVLLFFVPIVGIILDKESLVTEFDSKLPFLANTPEGAQLKQVLRMASQEGNVGGVVMDKEQVKNILARGDYTEGELATALKELCEE